MISTAQHLRALSMEAAAEDLAAAEGWTVLQAVRHLRDREVMTRRVRRAYRD